MKSLQTIAQELEEKYLSGEHFDFSPDKEESSVHNIHEVVRDKLHTDPSVVLQEHEGTPRSYMVFNNLKTIIMDASELLSIMNENDELPAWTQELISNSKMNVGKALDYVRAEKSE